MNEKKVLNYRINKANKFQRKQACRTKIIFSTGKAPKTF